MGEQLEASVAHHYIVERKARWVGCRVGVVVEQVWKNRGRRWIVSVTDSIAGRLDWGCGYGFGS
jgi:hypothetical protein